MVDMPIAIGINTIIRLCGIFSARLQSFSG